MLRLDNKNTARRQRLFAALMSTAFSALFSMQALAVVGRTPGQFNVSPSGAATYSVPVFTPPGPHGMQPSIALVYNSRAGIGPLGRGWSIGGLSAITRCGKTAAQDANAGAVTLATADAYCLNGNRLRKISGTYGVAGSTYQTEIADFSLVTAVGTAGSGPASFTVQTRDGLTYEYGNTSDSQILATGTSTPHTWMANLIKDRSNNRIQFTYDTLGTGTVVPIKIEWAATSHGASTFVNEMTFSYGTNTPETTPTGFIAGTEYENEALLESISVAVSGTVKRRYDLTYETSPTTGAKRLTGIQGSTDAAGSDLMAGTVAVYQNGAAGVDTTPQATLGTAVSNLITDHDYNGDGIEDILYEDGGTWYVSFGSTSGLTSAVSTGITGKVISGDVLGTGKDQFLAVNSGTWYAYEWNGSSFTGTSTGVTVAGSAAEVALADVNGDGKAEMVYVASVSTTDVTMAVRPNTSSGSSLSFGSAVTSSSEPFVENPYTEFTLSAHVMPPTAATASPRSYDFNGDSRQDVIVEVGGARCLTGYGCVPTLRRWGMVAADGFQYEHRLDVGEAIDTNPMPNYHALNANNDQCTDFLYTILVISKCNGSDVATVSSSSSMVGTVDWDGDGRMDMLTKPFGSSTLKVSLSTGDGFGTETETGFTATGCKVLRVDTDGDGLDDLMCWAPDGSLSIYAHNSAGQMPDLATQLWDGFSIGYGLTYTPATWGGHTPHTDSVYPNRDYQGPLQIVTQVYSADGAGEDSYRYYEYSGGAMDLQGRGFAGFASRKVTDSRADAPYVIDYYSRDFPYTGMLTKSEVYQSDGTLISRRNVSLTETLLDGTSGSERHFVYSNGGDSSTYEVGGSLNGQLVTQMSESRTYDSWGNVTVASTVTTDKDSTSPLYNHTWTQALSASITVDDGTNWCLNLPTSTSVTYSSSVSGETSVTRSKEYEPDYVKCRMDVEKTEPSGGNRRVDVAYGYDDFGNVDTVSVTGRNAGGSSMATRTSSVGWGATGQFPVTETNALGQTTTRTYDGTFGSIATETDPNGILVQSNEYDSVGHIARATRADGTSTVYSYYYCFNFDDCQNGDPGNTSTWLDKLYVIASERDTSDNQISTTVTHLDRFERPFIAVSRTLSGGYSRVGRQYDAFGRVYRETAPCEASSCSTYWVTNTYDALGRLIQQSRPESQSVSTPVTTTFSYAGRTQTVTDPQGKVTTKILDVKGQMRRSQDHDGYYQSLDYDAFGSLQAVNDSLSHSLFTASYSYGIQAFQDSSFDMDLGARTYSRNSLGELTGWTDAKSQSFGQTYDALSRVTARSEPDGTTIWNWGDSVDADPYNIGRLTSASLGGYSESLVYDNVGRVSTRSVTTDQTYDIDYAYNDEGQLDTLTWPTSTASTRVAVKYGYGYGILKSVTDYTGGSTGTVYWEANAQNARGQITQETLGNGVVTSRAFDAVTGQVSSIQSGVSGGSGLQNESYLYDLIGNVTQRQNSNAGLTENFYYDNLYRLSYSQLNGSTNLSMTYDGMGNITSKSDVASGASWTYGHTTKKHAVTQAGSGSYAYSYDDNGNMISRSGETISWTSYNYPSALATSTESTSFLYGPDRQYVRQVYTGSSGTETTHYVGGILEKVEVGGVTDWRHSVQVGGQIVAIISRKSTGTNAVNYLLGDHQGSLSALTDDVGARVVQESFSPFGLPRDGAAWSGAVSSGDEAAIAGISRRGYTGHSMLGSMGLIHMNGRVQDAITGRFLSPDPYVQDPAFTQSYNRYAYAMNNPLSYIDPSGFFYMCWRPFGLPVFDGPAGEPAQYGEEVLPFEALVEANRINSCGDLDDIWPIHRPEHSVPNDDGGSGPGPGPSAPTGTPADAAPVSPKTNPRNRGPQGITQKLKSWVCRAGNSLVEKVDKLGSLGLKLQLSGAAIATAGLIAQPEINPPATVAVGGGVALMGTGGAFGLLANTFQVVGGIAQMIGSDDASVGAANTKAGSYVMLFGAGTGWLGSASYKAGNSVAARKFNSAADRDAAFSGAGVDVSISAIPDLSLRQAECGS